MSLFYKIKSKVLSFLSDIRFYPGGFILFGSSSYGIKGSETREIINELLPGDILLRRYAHYLGSRLIPGYFSHAAVYVGHNNVIHMLGEGINKEDILTFLRCDDICILRPRDMFKAEQAIIKAENHLKMGIEYDYEFDHDSAKRFYCTEFVDNCYDYVVKKMVKKDMIMPDDFLQLKKVIFDIVWMREKG